MHSRNKAVGLVGIGAIGAPLAERFLKEKYKVYIWNRTASKVDGLVRSGAILCATPKELASNCDRAILSLTTQSVVRKIICGKEGLIESFPKKGVIIDTSTIGPAAARKLSKELGQSGIDFLDAPVSGGTKRAKDGSLCVMVGGDVSAFMRSKRILNLIGSNVYYLGQSGAGQSAKLVNQVLVSINALATAESLSLASSLHLNMKILIEVLEKSSGDSTMFRAIAETFAGGDFDLNPFIYLMKKDLELILDQSPHHSGYKMSMSRLAHRIYSGAYSKGNPKPTIFDLASES